MALANSLPYPVESLEEMDERLEHIAGRLADCIQAGEHEQAFQYWSRQLQKYVERFGAICQRT